MGGLAEIAPDGKVGYVVEPDAKQIAKAIEKIYEENNFEKMSANVRAEKHRFSWEYFAMKMVGG